jgi:hypothetical protein
MRSWARTTNELAAGAGARIRIALCRVMSRQFGLSILQGDTLQIQYRRLFFHSPQKVSIRIQNEYS